MKIVLAGGSGQLGLMLARHFAKRNDEVVVLTRNAEKPGDPNSAARFVHWDVKGSGDWVNELDGSDVLINLAGRSVNCRYNSANRKQILDSRVDSTRALGMAINRIDSPPGIWLQSSTATIYSHRYDDSNDELTGILGGAEPNVPDTWKFGIQVAKEWEAAALEFARPETRQILMRTAMVMSPDKHGVFDTLMGLVRKGLGGTNGDGRQFVSWIHEFDFLNSLDWIIEHRSIDGCVNIASPCPLPNKAFMTTLRQANGTRFGLPANRLMLEIGAFIMRTETELVLKSRRVVPRRLLDSGFEFKYPEWKSAANEIAERWRTAR